LIRAEAETLSTIVMRNFCNIILVLFFISFSITSKFSSASSRSTKSEPIMFSETLARIRTISYDLPDPQRADRAMHSLICTNIKLTRRVLTRNLLRRLVRENVGTNEVEIYTARVCKQNVRKMRDVQLVRQAMCSKLRDAEYDEKMIRSEFVRTSVEYRRVTIRG
jgi:hypothetical protein